MGHIFWVEVNPQRPGCNPNARANDPGNWPGEENPLVDNNLPRYYVKKRRSNLGTIQYIATRHPLVRNFINEDGIQADPINPNDPQGPMQNEGRPDRFKGEIASIFCMENIGTMGNSKIEPDFIPHWNNCEVVETLVGLCLIDEQVTPRSIPGLQAPNDHSNLYLVDQAFPHPRQGDININAVSRLHARNMVMSGVCPRFARIALLIGNQPDQFGRQTHRTVAAWRKHLQGARRQGYVMAFVLGRAFSWHNCNRVQYHWDVYEVEHLENNLQALRDVMTRSILPTYGSSYWYFCCMEDGPNCNL